MNLISSVFNNGESIPKKFTCDGWNINPELIIQNPPAETKSFALIVEDPDSPNGNFTHWLVWNISRDTERIKEESAPPGSIEGENDFGNIGYGGPCPHEGEHRYIFKLFALDEIPDLREGINKKELLEAINRHILETAELAGKFKRENV